MEKQIDTTQLAAALFQMIGDVNAGKLGSRQKAVGSPNATYGHGSGGTFSYPGISPDVANAMIMPELGLQTKLPVRASRETNPLHAIMTGVTNISGDVPSSECADCQEVGLMELCMQTYVFGRWCLSTKVLDLTRVGQVNNRGEFTDYTLIGGPSENQIAPSVPADPTQALRTELAKQMFEFRVSWARQYAKKLYDSNPSNNSGTGYKEFRGLDMLINTGYKDAVTNVACNAADSFVQNFSSANISTSASAATELVNWITNIYRYLEQMADSTGLAPVTWEIVMPRMLFQEIAMRWPIAYYTTAATTVAAGQTNTQLAVDAKGQADMRDQMLNEQFLMIFGKRVSVTFDDAVVRNYSNGTFTSPIYFVPRFVLGSRPATYIEYFDFSAPGAAIEAAQVLAIRDAFYTSDAGRYLWVKKPHNNYCVQSQALEMSRVRLDFPMLAARITNISYTPLIGSHSPFPSDTDFYNGGSSSGSSFAPSFWPPNSAG